MTFWERNRFCLIMIIIEKLSFGCIKLQNVVEVTQKDFQCY